MKPKDDKKIPPLVVEHWDRKFERAIFILLKSGIKAEELIERIKNIENNEINKNQQI
jgi:hypothetical protein